MSLSNLEWYGWITLCLAISSSVNYLSVMYNAIHNKQDVDVYGIIPAIMMTLALWQMTP